MTDFEFSMPAEMIDYLAKPVDIKTLVKKVKGRMAN
jgi:hypothetical protein